jgi:hypothetical protein
MTDAALSSSEVSGQLWPLNPWVVSYQAEALRRAACATTLKGFVRNGFVYSEAQRRLKEQHYLNGFRQLRSLAYYLEHFMHDEILIRAHSNLGPFALERVNHEPLRIGSQHFFGGRANKTPNYLLSLRCRGIDNSHGREGILTAGGRPAPGVLERHSRCADREGRQLKMI